MTSFIVNDAVPTIKNLGVEYSKKSRRFVDTRSGRFVSQNNTIKIVKEGIAQGRKTLEIYAEQLANKSIDIDVFALGVAKEIKSLHILNAALAKNGRIDTIGKKELATLNTRIKQQLGSTKGFEGEKFGVFELVKDIYKGDVSLAQLKNRLSSFADSADQTQNYLILESKKALNFTQALRIMIGDTKTCFECRNYASLGWVGIDTLIMPGESCTCRSNCRCEVRYK